MGFLLEFEQFRKLLSGDELALLDLGRDDENGGRDTFFEGLVNAAGGLTGGRSTRSRQGTRPPARRKRSKHLASSVPSLCRYEMKTGPVGS